MASAQSRSKIRHSQQKAKLRETLKEFSETILSLAKRIIEVVTNSPVTSATIAGTLAVSPFAYHAVNSQLNAAFQELGGNQQEVLSHFLDQTTELLDHKTLDIPSNQLDEHSKQLLSANSFTVLRSLNGRGKGRLLRFLSEVELIQANQPAISLSGADLRDIDLQNAWLPDINLNGAYVLKGNLQKVNLKRADLVGTNLTGTDLTGANLRDANLTGANLTGANLRDANLDVDKAIQSGAKFCHATMPNGKPSTQPCP